MINSKDTQEYADRTKKEQTPLQGKTFSQLTEAEKTTLLKMVAEKLGLIKAS
jgi:hypothetical protein